MSLPARSALIAAGSCWNVYFVPGGPAIRRSWPAIFWPFDEFAATAARMQVIAASKLFTSSDCLSLVPGAAAYILSYAFVREVPSGTAGRVPRAPCIEAVGTNEGIVEGWPP